MLELSPDKVEELEKEVICDDEAAVRKEFKFRANMEKYPLVYVGRGLDGLVDRYPIDYVALIQRSEFGNIRYRPYHENRRVYEKKRISFRKQQREQSIVQFSYNLNQVALTGNN